MRWILILMGLVVAGCASSPPASPLTSLGVANDTTLALTVLVNGQSVASLPPGGSEEGSANLPPRPWTVTAQAPSGRVLATMTVGPGPADPAGSGYGQNGMSAQFPLTCGWIRMWTGNARPSNFEPPLAPGSVIDCAGG